MRAAVVNGNEPAGGSASRQDRCVIAALALQPQPAQRQGDGHHRWLTVGRRAGLPPLGAGPEPGEWWLYRPPQPWPGRADGLYRGCFHATGLGWPRCLLTRVIWPPGARYQNACRTWSRLLSWGWCQFVNEKRQPWPPDELRFGDKRHQLSALVASRGDRRHELVLLTDVDRLYSGNPRTDARPRPIEEVQHLAELARLSPCG